MNNIAVKIAMRLAGAFCLVMSLVTMHSVLYWFHDMLWEISEYGHDYTGMSRMMPYILYTAFWVSAGLALVWFSFSRENRQLGVKRLAEQAFLDNPN
jgi:hypothetical protein